MTDMLDFSAEFWENILEKEPLSVDNNSSKKGNLTYAANDYCGFDPVVSLWLQTPAKKERQLTNSSSAKRRSKRRA